MARRTTHTPTISAKKIEAVVTEIAHAAIGDSTPISPLARRIISRVPDEDHLQEVIIYLRQNARRLAGNSEAYIAQKALWLTANKRQTATAYAAHLGQPIHPNGEAMSIEEFFADPALSPEDQIIAREEYDERRASAQAILDSLILTGTEREHLALLRRGLRPVDIAAKRGTSRAATAVTFKSLRGKAVKAGWRPTKKQTAPT